jgi:fructose-specific PTS system IIC-like component
MALGVQRIAPGIGIFDPLLGLISPAWAYYIAVAVGLVLNVALIIIFKSIWLKRQAEKAQQAA